MIVAPCPRCDSAVTVPPARPTARVRCPRCQDEYTLAELFDALPPPLELLDPADAIGERNGHAMATATAGAAMTVGGEARSYDASPGYESDAPAAEFSFDEEPAPHMVQPASPGAVKASPRRRRKARNPLIEGAKIVIGGVIGIVLAQVIMWWGFMPLGVDAKTRDFASVGRNIGQVVPWIIPEDVRNLAETKPEDGGGNQPGNAGSNNSGNNGGNKGRGNQGGKKIPGGGKVNSFGVPTVDPNAGRPLGGNTDDPFSFDAGESDGGSDSAPIASADGGATDGGLDINLNIDGVIDGAAPKDPAAGGLDGELTIDPSAIPDNVDPLGLPGLPTDPINPPTEPAVTAGFHPPGLRTAADLRATVDDFRNAHDTFTAAETKTAKMGTDLYTSLAAFAETLARLDLNDEELASIEGDVNEALEMAMPMADGLARLTPWWQSNEDRVNDGVLVVGKVVSIKQIDGAYVESRIELAGKKEARVLGWISPGPGYQAGAKVMILGAIVEKPADELIGYTGKEPTRIIGGAVKILTPAPESTDSKD